MNKTRAFIFFGVFYLGGIFIGNWVGDFITSLFFFFSLVIIFVILYSNGYKKLFPYFMVILYAFIIGAFVSDINLGNIAHNKALIDDIPEKAYYETEIIRIDKISTDRISYVGKLIRVEGNTIEEKINILVYVNGSFRLNRGDIIAYDASKYPFESFNGFNYEKYMLGSSIYFSVYPYSVEKIGENNVNIIVKKIGNIRDSILNSIKELYTSEEAIFLSGILVGARENMPEKLGNNFNSSGLTHIIAVSGFNITILIIFFSFIIKPFPPYIRLSLIGIMIFLFTLLVGFNPPVVRASIMGFVGYLILVSGRKGNPIAIIVFTAMCMITLSPLSINYDVSLHLSFLAVLGILSTNNFFERSLGFLPNILEIRTALCLTLGALVFTLPIMIFNFGQISLISPITNILVSWTIPIIMLVSFVGLILYIFFPFLGVIISFFSRILLRWDIFIVNTFGEFKYSIIKIDFGQYKGYYEMVFFVVLIVIILLYKRKKTD